MGWQKRVDSRWDGRRGLIVDGHTFPRTHLLELLEYVVLPYHKDIHTPRGLDIPGVPKKVLRLINNKTNVFCLISEMFFVLDNGDPNSDFDILCFLFG